MDREREKEGGRSFDPILGDFRKILVEEVFQGRLPGFERTLAHHEAEDGAELRALKREHDPTNFFRLNQNIRL